MKNKVFKNNLKYLTQQSLVSSLARYVQVDDRVRHGLDLRVARGQIDVDPHESRGHFLAAFIAGSLPTFSSRSVTLVYLSIAALKFSGATRPRGAIQARGIKTGFRRPRRPRHLIAVNSDRPKPLTTRHKCVVPTVPCLRHNPRTIVAGSMGSVASDKSFFCRTGSTSSKTATFSLYECSTANSRREFRTRTRKSSSESDDEDALRCARGSSER
jgi:hypothetical protein